MISWLLPLFSKNPFFKWLVLGEFASVLGGRIKPNLILDLFKLLEPLEGI